MCWMCTDDKHLISEMKFHYPSVDPKAVTEYSIWINLYIQYQRIYHLCSREEAVLKETCKHNNQNTFLLWNTSIRGGNIYIEVVFFLCKRKNKNTILSIFSREGTRLTLTPYKRNSASVST